MRSALAAILLATTASVSVAQMDGPRRDKPMEDLDLLAFLDAAAYATALNRHCPNAFSSDDSDLIRLAYRWGRAVGTSDAYPTQLYLTAIQQAAQHSEAITSVDCAAPETAALVESFAGFMTQVADTVRLSEMQ